jgi:hypothetical protein
MKPSTLLAAGSVAACLFAGPAVAQTPSTPMKEGEMMGKHTMDGEVTSIDSKKGWVHVKTAEGTLTLHYPPTALQSVKKGDHVSVELGLQDHGPAMKK